MSLQKKRSGNKKEIERLQLELKNKELEVDSLNEKLIINEEIHKKYERLLHSLVEAAAGKIGQDFFDNIVIRLSQWLNAECVLIGQIVDYERVKAVPLYLDGKISYDFSYELAGSPCDITTRKGYCEYTENVIHLFPKDQILVDLNAESYIGTALYNNKGDINGVICAVSRRKLEIPPYAKDIMKIIGARVSAEIERINAEKALRDSEAALKTSNATKDKLFSIIAHDLRNPFNIILGFSDLLLDNKREFKADKAKFLLEKIQSSAKSAYSLLENLLAWALSQRDLLTYKAEILDLAQIADESITLFQNMACEKQIALINTVPKNLKVKADRDMLSTIIRNLMSNAIKYSRLGGDVVISAKKALFASEEVAEIYVKDNGVGIDPAIIEKLFQIDRNYTECGTAEEKGTGLGLIICKDFIERNGGEITVESEPGSGSMFVFTLKVA
jgi:signal transduction histidine kinase